jgi:hypothetical protein
MIYLEFSTCTALHRSCPRWTPFIKCCQTSVLINTPTKATDYRLGGRGIWGRFQAGVRDYFLLHNIQNDSGALPASHPKASGGSSTEVKVLRRDANHASQISAEVLNMWIYTPTPPYVYDVVLN